MITPKIIAAKTSLGKWTNKYSLEKVIRVARMIAIIPNFLSAYVIITALIVDAKVWPDGKE